MNFLQNIPFFSIMISMFSATISSVLSGKLARRLNAIMITVVGCMSAILLVFLIQSDIGSYTYMMGHFPAPWGNEIRAGVLEAGMALFFCIIMLLSILGGRKKLFDEVEVTNSTTYITRECRVNRDCNGDQKTLTADENHNILVITFGSEVYTASNMIKFLTRHGKLLM